jgi:hypothetical protein
MHTLICSYPHAKEKGMGCFKPMKHSFRLLMVGERNGVASADGDTVHFQWLVEARKYTVRVLFFYLHFKNT